MIQILRENVRSIFVCYVIDEVALLAKNESSRCYVTEEPTKRHWQTPQKQSDLNLNGFLNSFKNSLF